MADVDMDCQPALGSPMIVDLSVWRPSSRTSGVYYRHGDYKLPHAVKVCERCGHEFMGRSAQACCSKRCARLGVRIVSGHWNQGEDQHCAKLTDVDVEDIRVLHKIGLSEAHPRHTGACECPWKQTALADWYGLASSNISRAVRGVTWNHVEELLA
jgi:hypothetical protein